MSDVFISYASADREQAGMLARALEARGWSVWWDRTIPPGRQFDEVIEEALDAAKCVVVLWSKASTASSWVKTEAAEAMRRKALIPAMLSADVKIPLEFRRLQAANLAHWRGEASTPEFEQFCDAIASSVAPHGGDEPAPPAPPPPPRPPEPPPPAPPPGPPDP
ncbi:MAG: toll/interleukin-1 receptor domain-containing protein, partial [Caldimonas sp.]